MKNKMKAEDFFTQQLDNYCTENGAKPTCSLNDTQNDNGKENLDEAFELLQFSKSIASEDFSKHSNKQAVWEQIQQRIEMQHDANNCANKKSNRKYVLLSSTAAVLAICVLFTQTSFAQNVIDNVIRTFSTGRIEISQMPSERPLPDSLAGKLFDENGKAIEMFDRNAGEQQFYMEDGTPIESLEEYMKSLLPEADYEKFDSDEDGILIVNDLSKLNDYTCFSVILPDYLPEGYEFDRAEFYKDDDGKVENTKYISLYFVNAETKNPDDFIVFHQRVADEETAYSIATDYEIAPAKVNGLDAVLTVDRNIDWETDAMFYSIMGRGNLISQELVRIAESVQP